MGDHDGAAVIQGLDGAYPDRPVVGEQCPLEESTGADVGNEVVHDGSSQEWGRGWIAMRCSSGAQ
jgi:hypothetical protein